MNTLRWMRLINKFEKKNAINWTVVNSTGVFNIRTDAQESLMAMHNNAQDEWIAWQCWNLLDFNATLLFTFALFFVVCRVFSVRIMHKLTWAVDPFFKVADIPLSFSIVSPSLSLFCLHSITSLMFIVQLVLVHELNKRFCSELFYWNLVRFL